MKTRCSADVHNDFGVSFHQCIRNGKVQVGGKWYCGIHDPDAVAAKRLKRSAEQDQKLLACFEREKDDARAVKRLPKIEALCVELREALVIAKWYMLSHSPAALNSDVEAARGALAKAAEILDVKESA